MTYVVVKNTSFMEGRNTNQTKNSRGPVSVNVGGVQYNFGNEETKTLPEYIALQVLAADNRLVEISRS